MLYICTPFKNMVSEVKILSCSSSKDLAEKISNTFGHPLAICEMQKFSDGEFQI